jgi:purine-nucleoside phosphorylase
MDRDVTSSLQAVRRWLGDWRPELALVLGSGLGELANRLEGSRRLPYAEIAGFEVPGVPGHRGELVAGRLAGRRVLIQNGRFHAYEGHPADTVALPVRVFADLGVTILLLTNAAGGIGAGLRAGSLMLLADHLNLTFGNPLLGPVRSGDTRFPDMSSPYDPVLRRTAREVAREQGIALVEGVYAGVPGPSYETAAEIRMLRRLGADAVGMSTVLEVIAARAAGIRCLGVSIITNLAAGLSRGRLSHDEVMRAAGEAGERLGRLLTGVVSRV